MKDCIFIVGVGLVGLFWAVLFVKCGYQVDVFEFCDDFWKVGFKGGWFINLVMSDWGWKVMEWVGIKDMIW